MKLLKNKVFQYLLFAFSLLLFFCLLFLNLNFSRRISQQKTEKVESPSTSSKDEVSPTPLPKECSEDKGFHPEGMTVYHQLQGLKTRIAWEGRVKEINKEKIVIVPMAGGEEKKEILKDNVLSINIVGERDDKKAFLPIREDGRWDEIKVGDHVTFNFQKPDLEEGILLIVGD